MLICKHVHGFVDLDAGGNHDRDAAAEGTYRAAFEHGISHVRFIPLVFINTHIVQYRFFRRLQVRHYQNRPQT